MGFYVYPYLYSGMQTTEHLKIHLRYQVWECKEVESQGQQNRIYINAGQHTHAQFVETIAEYLAADIGNNKIMNANSLRKANITRI